MLTVRSSSGRREPFRDFYKWAMAVRYRHEDVDEYERRALVDTQAQADRTPV